MPPRTVLLVRIAGVFFAALAMTLLLGPFAAPAGLDKLAHALGFYSLTLLALASLPRNRKGDVACAMVALGVLSEVAQGLTGRDMQGLDMLADAAGVGAATVPLYVARFRRLAQRDGSATRRGRRRRDGTASSRAGLEKAAL